METGTVLAVDSAVQAALSTSVHSEARGTRLGAQAGYVSPGTATDRRCDPGKWHRLSEL